MQVLFSPPNLEARRVSAIIDQGDKENKYFNELMSNNSLFILIYYDFHGRTFCSKDYI